MVSIIATGKSFEVKEKNESLDAIFKGHILRLKIVKNLRVQKIDYFSTRDLFSLKSLLAL